MCSASALPALWPRPGTTLNTAGRQHRPRTASSATLSAVSGDFSDGLSTRELPAASTGANFHAAISSGKFHGTIAPTTPIGSRVISASAPGPVGATSSYTLSIASAYHWTQRAAPGMSTLRLSVMGLPMSSVSSSASSSACSRISFREAQQDLLALPPARGSPSCPCGTRRARRRRRGRCLPGHRQATRASSLPVAGLMQSKVAPGGRVAIAPVDKGLGAELQRAGALVPGDGFRFGVHRLAYAS